MDFIEIIHVKEEKDDLLPEHMDLLNSRLQKIEKGQVNFKSWDVIKEKYENKILEY
jgi:hypothetical protein